MDVFFIWVLSEKKSILSYLDWDSSHLLDEITLGSMSQPEYVWFYIKTNIGIM